MNRKAAPPGPEITGRCDHKLAASDNAGSFIEVWFLTQWDHIRQHQRELPSPCAKNPGPSGVCASGRVHVWLCVHKPAPRQSPFCRPEATSPRRGFDKPTIPFPLQVGPAPEISFDMVKEGYSPVVLPLPLYPRYAQCVCNGEVRWVLSQIVTL